MPLGTHTLVKVADLKSTRPCSKSVAIFMYKIQWEDQGVRLLCLGKLEKTSKKIWYLSWHENKHVFFFFHIINKEAEGVGVRMRLRMWVRTHRTSSEITLSLYFLWELRKARKTRGMGQCPGHIKRAFEYQAIANTTSI